MWYHGGITIGSEATVEYNPDQHGTVLVEYVEEPDTGYTYRLTSEGYVFRQIEGGTWRKYYEIQLTAVPAHVASIRRAPYQRVLADHYTGRVPVLSAGGTYGRTGSAKLVFGRDDKQGAGKRRRERMAKPKKEEASSPDAASGPQRLGARARRTLESFGLTDAEQKDVLERADALSRARTLPNGKQDTMTRIWDIYESAGRDVPENLVAERDKFLSTGVQRPSGGGAGKAPRGGRSEDSPTPRSETSPSPSGTPNEQPGDDGTAVTPPQPDPLTSGSSDDATETL